MANYGMSIRQESVYHDVIKGQIPNKIQSEIRQFLQALPEPLIEKAEGKEGDREEWLFAGRDYSYGRNRTVRPTGPFSRCEAFVRPIVQALGLQAPNAMLLVYYPYGTKGLSAHRDDEEAHATDQVITLCFGAPATIFLTDNSTRRRYSDFVMNDGEFYVFKSQDHFKHGVEKILPTEGGRWAFTYRVFKEKHVKCTSPLLPTPANFTPPSLIKTPASHQKSAYTKSNIPYTVPFPALGDSSKENLTSPKSRTESPTTTYSNVLAKSPAVTRIVTPSSSKQSPFVSPIGHGTRLGTVAKKWWKEQKFDPKVTAIPVNPDPKITRKINSMQNNKFTQLTKSTKTKSKSLPGTVEKNTIVKITETPKIENKKSNSHQNKQNTDKNTKTMNQISKKSSSKAENRVVTPPNKLKKTSKLKENKKESPINVNSNSTEKLNSNSQKTSTKQNKVSVKCNENKEKSPVKNNSNKTKVKLTINTKSVQNPPEKKIENVNSAAVKEIQNDKTVKIAEEENSSKMAKGTNPTTGLKQNQTDKEKSETHNASVVKNQNETQTGQKTKNQSESLSDNSKILEISDRINQNAIALEPDKIKFLINLKPGMTSTPVLENKKESKEAIVRTKKSNKEASDSTNKAAKTNQNNKDTNELRNLIINSPKKLEKIKKNEKSNSQKSEKKKKNEVESKDKNADKESKNQQIDEKQKVAESNTRNHSMANGTSNNKNNGNIVRTGNTLSITLPIKEFPQCTECDLIIKGLKYQKMIGYWKVHYANKHKIKIETVEYLCSLCGEYSEEKPKEHECFKTRSYFVTPKDTFEHKCKKCGGSFLTATQQTKHRCAIIEHLNKKERDRESITETKMNPNGNNTHTNDSSGNSTKSLIDDGLIDNNNTNNNERFDGNLISFNDMTEDTSENSGMNTPPFGDNPLTDILVNDTQIENTNKSETHIIDSDSSSDSTRLIIDYKTDEESSTDHSEQQTDINITDEHLNANSDTSQNIETTQTDILALDTQTSEIVEQISNNETSIIPESQTENNNNDNSPNNTAESANNIASQELFNTQEIDQQHEHNNISNNDSLNTTNDSEPGCFRRQNPGNPAQPAFQPGTVCRIEQTIHVVFPFTRVIRCPETTCMLPIVQKQWSDAQLSLIRHVRNAHNIDNITIQKWCGTCNREVNTNKLSRHGCFRDGFFNPSLENLNLEFPCTHVNCKLSYPTQIGLDNHFRKHKREKIKQKNKITNLKEYVKNKQTITQEINEAQNNPEGQTVNTQSTNNTQGSTELDDIGASMIPPTQEEDQVQSTQPMENNDNDDSDSSPSREFAEKFHRILECAEMDKWDEFIEMTDEYISFAQNHVKLPPPRDTNGAGKSNAKDPRLIQQGYRRNRRRAVRDVLGEVRKPCTIDPNTMAEHFFKNEPFARCNDDFGDLPHADYEVDVESFSSGEIWTRLCKAENTSPGSDRLTYAHWKSVDPEAKTLSTIFNICLKYGRVPPIWKTSRTIFIPKSGEGNEPANWRPISLCSTISKLFTGCLAKRLTNWAVENKTLSHAQKGFMPFDGAFENNYVLEQTIQAARKDNKEICFASIDLANAFGSAPHEVIIDTLQKTGAGTKTTNLVSNLLDDVNTYTVTDSGISEPRAIKRGVRQGDPLSGILFNFGVDRLIRALTGLGLGITVLAFADDILIMAPNAEALQVALDTVSVVCLEIGLTVNPNKCCSMHLGINPRRNLDTIFLINQNPIVTMTEGDPHTFLGKPVGYNIFKDHLQLQEFYETGTAIIESQLAPWQKLDALKSFFFPSLAYAQRTNQIAKGQWRELDDELRRGVKKRILDLPSRAANEYLYGHTDDSLLGIPLASDDHDIAHIDGAFKLLTSNDETVAELAWKDLGTQVAARNRGRTVTFHDCEEYLSGVRLRGTNPNESIFSRARMASNRQGVTWHIQADQSMSITIGSTVIADRRKIFRSIRDHIRKTHSNNLKNKKNQGKTQPCFSKSKVSAHYLRNGDFIRFADWKFIHRARLNLHSLNGANPSNTTEEKKCRRCRGEFEGLPHVLCHCMRNMQMITDRHNAIVKRVRTAATRRWSILKENQPVMGTALRPDLVLAKDNSLLILDVAVTFENGPDAFDKIRDIKIKKYTPLVELYKHRYSDIKVVAIVVGALGGWDPKNDRVLSRICSKKYSKLMRKLIVSDTLKHSRDIFNYHTGGKMKSDKQTNEPGTIALNTISEINNRLIDIEQHNNQNPPHGSPLEPHVQLTSSLESSSPQEPLTQNQRDIVIDLMDAIGSSLTDVGNTEAPEQETAAENCTIPTVTTPIVTNSKEGRKSRIPVAIAQTKKPLNIDFCDVQIPTELVVPDADGARMSASKSFSQTTVNQIIRTFNVMVVTSPKEQTCLIKEDFLPTDVCGDQSMPPKITLESGDNSSPPRTLSGEPISATDISRQKNGENEEEISNQENCNISSVCNAVVYKSV